MISEKLVIGVAIAAGVAAFMCLKSAKKRVEGDDELKAKGKQVVNDTVELGKAVGAVAKNVASDAFEEIKKAKDSIVDDLEKVKADTNSADSDVEIIEEDTRGVDSDLEKAAFSDSVVEDIESILSDDIDVAVDSDKPDGDDDYSNNKSDDIDL